MKYRELIQFDPIVTVIELKSADDSAKAKELVRSYVMSDHMADLVSAKILSQLKLEDVVDNKGVLLVGNYGTGKSHLMSVISAIGADSSYLDLAQNERFRAAETVEKVRLEQKDFNFLYEQGDALIFMDTETYEQLELQKDFVGDRAAFLQDGMTVTVELYEERPIGISLPQQVWLLQDQLEWQTARLRVARGGFGLSLLPEWEGQVDALLAALGAAYNRTKFLKERTAMMQKWADYLDKLKAGAEVIPLHGSAA